MTQTDYDKALEECIQSIPQKLLTQREVTEIVFRKGYEYGVWSQMEKQKAEQQAHECNLVALGDEYMTAYKAAQEKGIAKINGKSIYEAYHKGWDDADTFDEDWTKAHPKDLLDRILDEYPDMIENEVKARMRDLKNECEVTQKFPSHCEKCPKMCDSEDETTQKFPFSETNHFRDNTKMPRMEIAVRAMAAIIPTTSPKNYQAVSQVAVNYADALIAELEKVF